MPSPGTPATRRATAHQASRRARRHRGARRRGVRRARPGRLDRVQPPRSTVGRRRSRDRRDRSVRVRPRERAPTKVELVGSWIPFEEPAGGPNFSLWAERTNYDINIDNDGDAFADVVYRWRFRTHHRNPDSFIYNDGRVTSLDDENLLIYQTYDLTRIKNGHTTTLLNDAPVVPSHVGDASMPDHNGDLFDAGVEAVGGVSSWVGQSDDAFFLDLRVFDLLDGGDFSQAGDDTLDGSTSTRWSCRCPSRTSADRTTA